MAYYYQRDRDLGQTFTVGAQGFILDAVTLRVGFDPAANQGAAGGARVSMQLLEVTGTPTINNSGSPPKSQTQWETYDPNNLITDDYITGETCTSLRIARGGVLPANVGKDMFLRWDLTGEDELLLEAGKRYAFVVMFDEPAANRGLALANNFTGPYTGGHAIRRCGSTLDRATVFVRDPGDPADVEASRQSAMFPADMAVRAAISPGTLGYPDVDTYRDFRFYIQGIVPPQPPPPLTTATGSGADSFIDSSAPTTAQGAANRARIRTVGTLHKAYFRFDLSGVALGDAAELSFRMVTADSTLPNPFTVQVHGLNDGDPGEGWSESAMTWNSGAPAHDGTVAVTSAATSLGSFTIAGGAVAAGQTITLTSTKLPGLLPFLHTDSDQRVTFILSYTTSTDKSLDFSTKESSAYGGVGLTIAPVVAAASPVTTTLPAVAALAGTVDGSTTLAIGTTVAWSKVSGPGTVSFGSAVSPVSGAAFSLPGSYVVALTATRGNFTRTARVAVTVRDSFGAWAERAFPPGTPAAARVFMVDPNDDGLANRLEYALRADPMSVSTAELPYPGLEGGFVTLTYRRNLQAADLAYTVLESETLAAWQAANPANEVLFDDGALRIIKARVPTGGGSRKFLRLEVTGP